MKARLLALGALTLIFLISCNRDGDDISPESAHIIAYFKAVALGFEFGNASEVTRKWNSELKVFVGGATSPALLLELDRIINEINDLSTDGFTMSVVEDSTFSNYYIFFGSGTAYAKIFPSQSGYVSDNWGLFTVYFNDQNYLLSGHMYVDILRANTQEQKHILREELTQSLGMARDSPLYSDSIFQSRWTTTTEYAPIDKDIIRLLYHPDMRVGLDEDQVERVLKKILESELDAHLDGRTVAQIKHRQEFVSS